MVRVRFFNAGPATGRGTTVAHTLAKGDDELLVMMRWEHADHSESTQVLSYPLSNSELAGLARAGAPGKAPQIPVQEIPALAKLRRFSAREPKTANRISLSPARDCAKLVSAACPQGDGGLPCCPRPSAM